MVARSIESAYVSATQAALIVRHPDPGVVIARGADRLDLLHRMSTNDVAWISARTIRRTVLTNPIGHIVDVLRLLSLEDQAFLLTSPGRAEAVRKWLARYIFFQDEVQLSLGSTAWSEWALYGPRSGEELLSAFADVTLPAGEAIASLEGGYVWRVGRPAAGGFHLLLDPDRTQRVMDLWRGRGGYEVDSGAYQILRIEAGIPEPDREIQPDSIPLEVGLRDAISFTKGCYIGQEIIARMDSRGRQAHTLVGLRLSTEAKPGDIIYRGGHDVGALTSAAHSPSLGWIALGSVRPSALEGDPPEVQVGPLRASARVTPLPLTETYEATARL
jgi:folate-binding protein YgfZ